MQRIREAAVVAARGRCRKAGELRRVRPPGTRLSARRRVWTFGPRWGAGDIQQHLQALARQIADAGVDRAPVVSGAGGIGGVERRRGLDGATSDHVRLTRTMLAPSATALGIQIVLADGASPVSAGSAPNPSVRPSARASRACTPRPSSTTATTSRRRRTPGAEFSSCGGDARARAPRRRGRCRSGRWAAGPSPPPLVEPLNALNTLAAGDDPPPADAAETDRSRSCGALDRPRPRPRRGGRLGERRRGDPGRPLCRGKARAGSKPGSHRLPPRCYRPHRHRWRSRRALPDGQRSRSRGARYLSAARRPRSGPSRRTGLRPSSPAGQACDRTPQPRLERQQAGPAQSRRASRIGIRSTAAPADGRRGILAA